MLEAAGQSDAGAIHPGYGFLSEDPTFAAAVGAPGLVWVGPTAEAIEQMGDKIRARNLVAAAGVPVSPGTTSPLADGAAAVVAAREIGFPLMVKASAGGGGMGMGVAADEESLPGRVRACTWLRRADVRRSGGALGAFLPRVRHVEVQVLGLADGRIVALGERDCSVQRRNQKLVEETPSPAVDDALRRALCQAAVRAAETVAYRGAGTVEFLLDPASGEFVFLEMNTRLQVEHPITEMVTGLDLVEAQLRVAAGEPVRLRPGGVRRRARHRDAGQRRGPEAVPAGPGDQGLGGADRRGSARGRGLRRGNVVTPHYDSLLAKLVVHGADREEALARAEPPWPASASRDRSATSRSSSSCSTRPSSSRGTTTRASSGGCAAGPVPSPGRSDRLGPLWLDADAPAGRPAHRGEGVRVAEEIRAEMVANVWKVVVAAGDTVEDGDTLVILESMKMEIPVITETSGTVSALHVAEGDVVQEGDVIAVIG